MRLRRPIPVKLSPAARRTRYLARRMAWVLIVVATVAALSAADQAGLFGRFYRGDYERYHNAVFHVVKVVDGDTIDVDAPDRRTGHSTTRIRLWGVDTPETVKPNTPPQHFGPEASEFTKRMCAGRSVRLELVEGNTRDKYNRLLAYVVLPDGRCLNTALAAQGYAYVYLGSEARYDHPRADEYRRLQTRARKAGLGLWKSARQSDLPWYLQDKIRLDVQR
jgi:micrococcal nuclease